MAKTFILDTNVLLHDINSIKAFEDNNVVIPITVIEELDNFKTAEDERGKNARMVSRLLDSLREKGKLNEGVKLENGGTLKIDMGTENILPPFLSLNKPDNAILNTAYYYFKIKKQNVITVSKDTNLRLKAEALGLKSQDYTTDKINYDELYTGMREMTVPAYKIDKFYKEKKVSLDGEFYPNEFVILKADDDSNKSAMGRMSQNGDSILKALSAKEPSPWGIKPLNKEQRFAMELLLDDKLDLVTIVGSAGTGKTLISLATGMERTFDSEKYKRLVICRSVVPVGRDIGFLPGTKEEKLDVWMGAIYDNLEFLAEIKHPGDNSEDQIKYIMDSGKVEIASLTHIRGRSLPRQYIIVDDAQNMTAHEMKTILSRAGENTKVVVTGDPHQIDTPYLDPESNGLTYVVERLKGQKTYGHIKFTKTERSPLADMIARLL